MSLKIKWDFNKALKTIKERLSLYGVDIQSYLDSSANLVGSLFVPAQLAVFNINLDKEDAFYLVANKVFIACDTFCYGIPGKFNQSWREVVGEDVYNTFQSAIFEEISQRFLSNSFPEFQNAQTLIPENFTFTPNSSIGGSNVGDYLNAITKTKLININWDDIDPTKQYDPKYFKKEIKFLLDDMSNLKLSPTQETQVLLSKKDGALDREDVNNFATVNELTTIDGKCEKIKLDIASINNNINSLNKTIATLQDPKRLIVPSIDRWDANNTYNSGDFCFYAQNIYCARVSNQNQVPTPNSNYWVNVSQVYRSVGGDLVYRAGTDLKFSFTNPNFHFYISLDTFLNADKVLATVNDIYNAIQSRLRYEAVNENTDFSLDNALELVNNLFGLNLNSDDYSKDISSDITKGLLTIVHAYGWPSENQVLLFNWSPDCLSLMDPIVCNWTGWFGTNDNFLRIGTETSGSGGSNLITQDNLPNVSYNLTHDHGLTDVTTDDYTLTFDDISLTVNFWWKQNDYVSIESDYFRSDDRNIFIVTASHDWEEYLNSYTLNFTDPDGNHYPVSWNFKNGHHHTFPKGATVNYTSLSLNLNPNSQTEFIPKYDYVRPLRITKSLPPELLQKIWVNILPIYSQQSELSTTLSGYYSKYESDKRWQELFNEHTQNATLGDINYVRRINESLEDKEIASYGIKPEKIDSLLTKFNQLNQSPDPAHPEKDGIATITYINNLITNYSNPANWDIEFLKSLASALSTYIHQDE